MIHENLRDIAANREIDTIKLVKNEANWPWFEGPKVKDQSELWSWKFRRPLISNLTCNCFFGLNVSKKIQILFVRLWIENTASYQMFSRKIFLLLAQIIFPLNSKLCNYYYCTQFQEFLPFDQFAFIGSNNISELSTFLFTLSNAEQLSSKQVIDTIKIGPTVLWATKINFQFYCWIWMFCLLLINIKYHWTFEIALLKISKEFW